jgi:hypothetical protein
VSKTRGEGRAEPEKSQSVIATREYLRQQAAQRKAEETEWADKCGPVTVRKIGESK